MLLKVAKKKREQATIRQNDTVTVNRFSSQQVLKSTGTPSWDAYDKGRAAHTQRGSSTAGRKKPRNKTREKRVWVRAQWAMEKPRHGNNVQPSFAL